jgi:aminoglycoside phosphotransferase (APT) family kinase protein
MTDQSHPSLDASIEDSIPTEHRGAIRRALGIAFPGASAIAFEPMTGGASGAKIYRASIDGVDRLLRIEANRGGLHDPVRQHACMRIAADAGVAPPVFYADPTDGVAIMDFITASTVESESARRERLASLARSVAALHAAPLFPPFMHFMEAMDTILANIAKTRAIPGPVLARLQHRYGEIATAYPRDDAELVSSHNDLNPSNVLFEGSHAWLIDWELAFAADRYVDVATILNFFTVELEDEERMLRGYFGDTLDNYCRARAFIMQQINRIYYAVMMVTVTAMSDPAFRLSEADFETKSFLEIRAGLTSVASTDGRVKFACIFLNDALTNMETQRFADALATLGRR